MPDPASKAPGQAGAQDGTNGCSHFLTTYLPGSCHICEYLAAHKLITVEFGTPLKPPTTHYAFPAGE